MTDTARLRELAGKLRGVVGWLAELDYPGVGTQMQRVTEAADALDELDASKARETGWLVELKGAVPMWWALPAPGGLSGDPEWTADSLKALRFARKQDAEAYADDQGWTEAFASEHEWSDPPPPHGDAK
jgi:hypothetical protein